jgi:hypothetical protein
MLLQSWLISRNCFEDVTEGAELYLGGRNWRIFEIRR